MLLFSPKYLLPSLKRSGNWKIKCLTRQNRNKISVNLLYSNQKKAQLFNISRFIFILLGGEAQRLKMRGRKYGVRCTLQAAVATGCWGSGENSHAGQPRIRQTGDRVKLNDPTQKKMFSSYKLLIAMSYNRQDPDRTNLINIYCR